MKETTPRHIVIKLLKTSDKEKNLKSNKSRKGCITYKTTNIKMTEHFSLKKKIQG